MTIKLRISNIRNNLFPYRSILFALFIIIIFHNSCIELLDKYILPIVSQIPNNNFIIAGCLILFSLFVCCFNYKQFYKSSYLISHTLLIEISVLGIYLYQIHYSHYDFYGYRNIDYVTIFLTPFFLAEVLRLIKVWKEKASKRTVHEEFPNSSFLIDTPCVDESKEREAYAEYLIQYILGTFKSYRKSTSQSNPFIKNGSFVINVGEEYGYGKTSFFALMHKKLTEKWTNQYVSFCYQPWLCENESAMVTELFNRFREELSPYAPQINKNITNYIRTLLDKSDNAFMHFFRIVFCQSSSMHEEREKLKGTITKLEKPIIVFIDDVDRLQKEELLTLLNLIRDTADFQHVFYIMAADKEYLANCLKKCNINNPEKYLKKIVNYDFMMPANDGMIMATLQKELISILEKYIKEEKELYIIVSSIINYENIESVFCNIRDIKRILNDYMVTLAVIKNGSKENIDYKDLLLLTIIKTLRPDVYKSLRDNDDQLLCLNNGTYILNPKYADVHNEKLHDLIHAVAIETNSNDTEKMKKCSTINEMMLDSRISGDEFVAHSLRYLFSSQVGVGDDIKIKHKESYYRYFSGQLRKNQLSNLEVEQILCYDEKTFQEQIKIIRDTNKTESFIARMIEWSKKWKNSPVILLRNISLFIEDDFSDEFSKSPHGLDRRKYEDDIYYLRRIRYSQILYNLFREGSTCKIDDEEKELLHKFLMEDAHYGFSARTLSVLLEQFHKHLIIEYDELVAWRRELIKQFIYNNIKNNQEPFKDEILDVIHVLRDGLFDSVCWDKEFADYLSNTSDYWSWFERLIIYEDGKFILNTKYRNQLNFFVVGNFENLINNCTENIRRDERVKDLKSLIYLRDFENINIEDHPALLFIKNKYDSN